MALTKITGSGIGTVTDNVVITSDDPTITMTDSSGTNDIATLQSTSGALIITVRDGTSDGEIIFKGDTGSAVTEHARIANTGLMTVISEGNAVQTSVQQGLIKQWVNLDGTSSGAAERDSFNTASTTDNGSGDYSASFTNAMANTNYGNAGEGGTGGGGTSHMFLCGHTKATGSTRVTNLSDGGGAGDRNIHSFITYGDLA